MNTLKPILLLVAIVAIVGSIIYVESGKVSRTSTGEGSTVAPRADSPFVEEKSRRYALAKEITTPDGFINTDKISVGEFVGKKVVLLDFWTYSCINCQRTIPHLNALYEKYKDKGLVIIGVHTPEFEFEKKYENVVTASEKFGITYPVVLDNDFSTWTAYKNQYWPRKYLIDIDGFVVYDHIGEGAYAETEKKIQELLQERAEVLGESVEGIDGGVAREGTEFPSRVERSPEVYFGATRNEFLGNGTPGTEGAQTFKRPASVAVNMLYLVGEWNIAGEYAENIKADGRIVFRYQGKDVHMVASVPQGSITVRVLRDGKPIPDSALGTDIQKTSAGTVFMAEGDRLYNIIKDPEQGEHTLEFIVESPGFRAFTFTFG